MRMRTASVVVVLAACIVYQQRSGPELTIGTVNNADMILMQRLSKEFERVKVEELTV